MYVCVCFSKQDPEGAGGSESAEDAGDEVCTCYEIGVKVQDLDSYFSFVLERIECVLAYRCLCL